MLNKIKKYISSLWEKTGGRLWKRIANDRTRAFAELCNRHVILFHIVMSLLICFLLELLSRHSLTAALGFVVDHPGPYLFNSFVIFAVFSLVFLVRRRTFLRMVILGLFVTMGIANCIILFNRVTPLGFTDLNMITDLLTMQNTHYFTLPQAIASFIAFVAYCSVLALIFKKSKKQDPATPFWVRLVAVLAIFVSVPFVTKGLIAANVLTSYFGNLAQGYLDYGYIYGFATSALDRGMNEPYGYSKSSVAAVINENDMGESVLKKDKRPNIVVVLLESFFDVSEADFIHTSEDPIPTFHYLEKNYSTGHCIVPVVGAGTCNTEFEVLTGMSCQFFGPGEYPQKTILKQTDVESIASDLSTLGYHSHVVHNNGGNFYSRANAFSMMGFDSFSSKEMLDITEYTPIGSWATDDILVGGTSDAMDSTKGPDFVYTITVEAHGDYPTERVVEDPAVRVTCDGKDEEKTNQWEYYINQIHSVDEFIHDYIKMFSKRDEDTLVIMFGDHLPTMGLTDDEVKTGDLFQTKYITWNNFGMKKKDMDLTSYQLVSMYLNRLGIHDGTMINYNQRKTLDKIKPGTDAYMDGLRLLQYDLLYGKRYAYDKENLYPASDIVMGSNEINISASYKYGDSVHIFGDGFSKWSKVYVNGEKVDTEYESGQRLVIDADDIHDGDIFVVNQVGSASTVFRSSNTMIYEAPEGAEEETEES